MRYKICVKCGKQFRCLKAEKCKYWLNPLEDHCECDNCNTANKRSLEWRNVNTTEKITFT